MKTYEFRETKGYCRLCEKGTVGRAVVVPFRYAGKNTPLILCVSCIKHLAEFVEGQK